jgi:hypothetical protein
MKHHSGRGEKQSASVVIGETGLETCLKRFLSYGIYFPTDEMRCFDVSVEIFLLLPHSMHI